MTIIKVKEYSLNYLSFNTYDDDLGFTPDSNKRICSIYAKLISDMPKWIREELGHPQVPVFHLTSFGTNSNMRRMGYGRQMLQYIKKYFTNCILLLEVSSLGEMSNQQLKAFYESEGFYEICPKNGFSMYYTMAIKL